MADTVAEGAVTANADDLLDWDRVKAEECKAIGWSDEARPNALCLSGGGIRSASFALGVIQGLAKAGLLGKFQYLSTVSGGGYIGGWLSAWRAHAKNDANVFAALNARDAKGEEAPELRHLRAYSNFLTPKLGLMSADTWTAVALYVRNLLLNWLIYLPLFAALLLFPVVALKTLEWLETLGPYVALGAAGIGALLLLIGLTASNRNRATEIIGKITQKTFLRRIVAPIYLAAVLFVTAAVGYSLEDQFAGYAGAAIYAMAWLFSRRDRRNWWPFVSWMISGVVFGLLLAVGVGLLEANRNGFVLLGVVIDHKLMLPLVVCLGVSWVLLSIQIAETVYVGLSSFVRDTDPEREWLARSSGWLSAVAFGWAAWSAISLFGAMWMSLLFSYSFGAIFGVGVGAASGAAAVVGGKSAKTVVNTAKKAVSKLSGETLLPLAALVFLLVLALLFAYGLEQLMTALSTPHSQEKSLSMILPLGLFAGFAIFSVIVSIFININRFSLHALYRNRLVRAFLGGARASLRGDAERKPDPFTGFDPKDNVKMADLKADKLFHVVNVALNTAGSKNLAWQERKAENFAITPLHCGNPEKSVGFRKSKIYGGPNGISLGTAVTISGAAASPNMGYHSSPLVGMVMMLFNVRLGWWLGNPGHATSWQTEGPRLSFLRVIEEMLGFTSDDKKYAYFSDGGHFENLALYEMIRRRCQYIVISDASCDPTFNFDDLGITLRKIKIDFGVEVEFGHKDGIFPRLSGKGTIAEQPSDKLKNGKHCAVAKIIYPPGPDRKPVEGQLIYIKPSVYGVEEPMDVRAYADTHPDFPHESTGDQWFSESQMESYRALGFHSVEEILGEGKSRTAGVMERLRGVAVDVADAARNALKMPEQEPTLKQFFDRAVAYVNAGRNGG